MIHCAACRPAAYHDVPPHPHFVQNRWSAAVIMMRWEAGKYGGWGVNRQGAARMIGIGRICRVGTGRGETEEDQSIPLGTKSRDARPV